MNQAGTPVSKPTESQGRAARIHLHQIERRQWWLSASAIVVTLLLTLGAASLASSMFYAQGGIFYLLDLRQAVSGLLGLVLLFDVYVIYQQLQIHRIRLQLNEQQEL